MRSQEPAMYHANAASRVFWVAGGERLAPDQSEFVKSLLALLRERLVPFPGAAEGVCRPRVAEMGETDRGQLRPV